MLTVENPKPFVALMALKTLDGLLFLPMAHNSFATPESMPLLDRRVCQALQKDPGVMEKVLGFVLMHGNPTPQTPLEWVALWVGLQILILPCRVDIFHKGILRT